METRQVSVAAAGEVRPFVDERSVQTQLKYMECLFDVDHICGQIGALKGSPHGSKQELESYVSKPDRIMAAELHRVTKENVEECAYNWVAPSFWQSMFGAIAEKKN